MRIKIKWRAESAWDAILSKVIKEGLSDKVTCRQRPEEVRLFGGKGNCKYRRPRARTCLKSSSHWQVRESARKQFSQSLAGHGSECDETPPEEGVVSSGSGDGRIPHVGNETEGQGGGCCHNPGDR